MPPCTVCIERGEHHLLPPVHRLLTDLASQPPPDSGTLRTVKARRTGSNTCSQSLYFDQRLLPQPHATADGTPLQGEIIAERYAGYLGVTNATRLVGWSFTKSLTSALVGLRLAESNLTLDSNVRPQAWSQEEAISRNVTIRSLLQQTSGLDWEEASVCSQVNPCLCWLGQACHVLQPILLCHIM